MQYRVQRQRRLRIHHPRLWWSALDQQERRLLRQLRLIWSAGFVRYQDHILLPLDAPGPRRIDLHTIDTYAL